MKNNGNPIDQDAHDDVEISEEQRAYIKKMLKRLMELGIGAVYGDEDNGENAVVFDCEERLPICKAVCCSFIFAITKEEVQKGLYNGIRNCPILLKERKMDIVPI